VVVRAVGEEPGAIRREAQQLTATSARRVRVPRLAAAGTALASSSRCSSSSSRRPCSSKAMLPGD
jgi:hypothetical protein